MIRILCSTKKLIIILCVFGTSYLQASLSALDDEMLDEIYGQAYINVESDTLAGSSHNYTRINFGINAKVQVNIDNLDIGIYDRPGETNPADIEIDNFALGHIEGNNIIPFEIEDPYIEIAYDNNGYADGFRLGFGSAFGSLSGDIQALTGYIPVNIEGPAAPLRASSTLFQQILLGVAGVQDNTLVRADGDMVNPSNGNPDFIRATHVGMANGTTLEAPNNPLTGALIGLFGASGCGVLGINTCFPLSNYKTLQIGTEANPTKGFFVSLSRTNGLQWKNLETNAAVDVTSGAYLYIPKVDGKAAIHVNFDEAFNGIPRLGTCYGSLDRGC